MCHRKVTYCDASTDRLETLKASDTFLKVRVVGRRLVSRCGRGGVGGGNGWRGGGGGEVVVTLSRHRTGQGDVAEQRVGGAKGQLTGQVKGADSRLVTRGMISTPRPIDLR